MGVLMLNVVDFDCPEPATTEKAVDLLQTYGHHEGREILHLTNGNAFVTYHDNEAGSGEVSAFVWEVVHPVSASTLRMAVFSFVVRRGTEDNQDVVDTVTMLTQKIAKSAFARDTATDSVDAHGTPKE